MILNEIFDKIYLISLASNINRRKFIESELNDLGIEYETIYGANYYSIMNDASGKRIKYPDVRVNDERLKYSSFQTNDFGSTVSHFIAVTLGYLNNYNRILIIEDDVCFIKDTNLLETMFNSIPLDSDFVTWDPRFISQEELDKFKHDINSTDRNYIELSGYNDLVGGMMYGIMNRKSMKLFLDNQRHNLMIVDHIKDFFREPTLIRYTPTKCILTDQRIIKNNFKDIIGYRNSYYEAGHNLTIDDFNHPDKCESMSCLLF